MPCKPSCTRLPLRSGGCRKSDDTNEPGQRRSDVDCCTARPEVGRQVTLLTYQVAKAKRIGSAAAKCSNQADLHSTFIDPIWPSDLPQRPSSTSMPLATDQMVIRGAAAETVVAVHSDVGAIDSEGERPRSSDWL